MTRFRAADSVAPMDDDVRALMADIDASLADLEKRLEARRSEDAAPDATEQLPGRMPERPTAPAVTANEVAREAPAAPPPSESFGFLAELAEEASAASGTGHSQAQLEAAQARQIHDALGRVFHFFNTLCRHANSLAPAIDRAYRLDTQTAFADLKWRDAATRSRLKSLAETSLLDYVVFRVGLWSPQPITVVRRWDQMEALQKELHILDLRPMEDINAQERLTQGQVRLLLAPEVPVQVTFRANYQRNRIDLLSRNLEGFGIAAFTCGAADVTQPFLDDFGRYLLARTSRLPVALTCIHCRAEL